MEENFFILGIWLIKVCMFCNFKEHLRAGVTPKDQGHIFSEKIKFFKRKMRGLFFLLKIGLIT